MSHITVIGGGFSGTLTAAHLQRRRDVRVTLVDRAGDGHGLAYAPSAAALLLNVPAGAMSAWQDDPDHFLRWLRQRDPDAEAMTFAPRATYGAYVREILKAAEAGGRVTVVRDVAIDLQSRQGYEVRLASGRTLRSDAVVLALGNAPPRALPAPLAARRPPPVVEHPLAVATEWAPHPMATVGIVGSGLTALDVLVLLQARGHRGSIVMISRHGLMPLAHPGAAAVGLPPVPRRLLRRPTVRSVLRWLRSVGDELVRAGLSPADALATVRSLTPDVWRALPEAERRRFLRHARTHWEVHRHRAAPAVHAAMRALLRDGRLRVHAARVLRCEASAGGRVRVHVRARRSAALLAFDVDLLLNCTGPERDVARNTDPLVTALLERGLIARDPLGLGIVTTADGAVVDATGAVASDLFVVGPLRIPDQWESGAVPELRCQAQAVAAALLERDSARTTYAGEAGYSAGASGSA